jgi:hypothetical protein
MLKGEVMNRKAIAGMLIAGFVFAGCATMGRNFEASQVPAIKIGSTTQSDIRDMFGAPWRTGIEDGNTTWTYGIYRYRLFGNPSTQDLVIRYDSSGIVTSYTYNTTEQQ